MYNFHPTDIDRFVIFLDIDGVLISYLNLKGEDKDLILPNAVAALNEIINFYDANLCMISSKNTEYKTEFAYAEFLQSVGIKVNGISFGDHKNRSKFILRQINQGLRKYLVIDDEPYQYFSKINSKLPIEYKRILAPNRYRGLDAFDVLQVTKNWDLSNTNPA